VEKALSEMPEGVKGFTIVWDTRNTGMKVRVGREGGREGGRRGLSFPLLPISTHTIIVSSLTTEHRQ